MAKRSRRRSAAGIIPRVARALWRGGRWIFRHPQPLVLAALVASGGWLLWRYVQRAEAFRIARIVLPPQSSLKMPPSLLGENLLTVDLGLLAQELKRQQPSLKDIRVTRQLPNVLQVTFVPRMPVAQVRLDRWYPVDRQGFVLAEASDEPAERLTQFVGFERATIPLRPGKDNADERLQLALRVLATLRRTQAPLARRLTQINVADPQGIRFLLDGQTEIRCGSEAELGAGLERLRASLNVIGRQPFEVGYIDVRFQEPVIGPRASASM